MLSIWVSFKFCCLVMKNEKFSHTSKMIAFVDYNLKLNLSQTTNFRLFHTEKVRRRQFQIR